MNHSSNPSKKTTSKLKIENTSGFLWAFKKKKILKK
jgi:hypothetical protein